MATMLRDAGRPNGSASESGVTSERRGRGVVGWAKRAALGAAALVVGLAATGTTYQAVASELDRRAFPAPGRLVEVGGHRLHVHELGADVAGPTVVLEAGAGGFSANWAWVQSEVAGFARVVSYDRAGHGWSEPNGQATDPFIVAEELRAALRAADIPGPYILVGHSLGGVYARAFAHLYPDEAAGLVLVDPGDPTIAARLPEEALGEVETFRRLMNALPLLANFGVARVVSPYEQLDDLPERQAAENRAFYSSAAHLAALRDDANQLAADSITARRIRDLGSLGDRPLVVLSRSEPDDVMTRVHHAAHAEQAALSTRGVHRIAADADHISLLSDRADAQATIDAIREAVDAVRAAR